MTLLPRLRNHNTKYNKLIEFKYFFPQHNVSINIVTLRYVGNYLACKYTACIITDLVTSWQCWINTSDVDSTVSRRHGALRIRMAFFEAVGVLLRWRLASAIDTEDAQKTLSQEASLWPRMSACRRCKSSVFRTAKWLILRRQCLVPTDSWLNIGWHRADIGTATAGVFCLPQRTPVALVYTTPPFENQGQYLQPASHQNRRVEVAPIYY